MRVDTGDQLKMGGETVTVDDIDGETYVLSDGRRKHASFVDPYIGDRVEHVPNGGERDTFIRFGDIPDNERSYDAANERREDGVSVYGEELVDGVHVPTEGQILGALLLLHRGAYLVSGERVGTGADGEPVIRNVDIEAELETPKGCKGFVPVDGN